MERSAAHEEMISLVGESDLADLLPLMRAYCEFYETAPADAGLLALARAAIADPEREGVQLIAREPGGRALGFASVFWSWDTTEACRVGIMNDLYVVSEARGSGVGRRLIEECARHATERGATRLDWQTAPGNALAQALYDGIGAHREQWLSYSFRV
ncbi:MAG TPA: GNAT family N-acetyltransferase [Solirubrobacteraceae bacterium]|nr:GNAT family N-acetyltransferase [Solirubrobacteraceae bacterium]